MTRELHYYITKEYNGFTILDYLHSMGYTRNIITHLKKTDNSILISGDWKYTNYKLSEGETLDIRLEENESSEILPVKMDLDIIYEDEDLMVINKPSGMPVHPSMGNYENTLANGLSYYFNEKNENFVFRCINRLDKDTSGLLIIGKNMLSASILYGEMKNNKIVKEYLALVEGEILSPGTINAPIAREEGSVITRCVDFENGQHAVTHYAPIKQIKNNTLVRVFLETGRTHQIRVHFAYINHPLVGDYLYNKKGSDTLTGQALHSYKLCFYHPISNEYLEFSLDAPF